MTECLGRERYELYSMSQKIITISLPAAMLAKLDAAARDEFATRSEFIRQAVTDRLRTVDGYRARMAEMAAAADMPTEDELFEIMRLRQAKRWYVDKKGVWHRRGDKGREL